MAEPHCSIVHLSGPRRGHVDVVHKLPASIGSRPDLDVVIEGTAPLHCQLLERKGQVVLHDSGSEFGTFLAGEPIREVALRDGDVLELGVGGPKLRFRREGPERVSFFQALAWARPQGAPDRLSDTASFVRALAHETATRTSRVFRVVLGGMVVAGLIAIGWSHWQSGKLQAELTRLRETIRAQAEEQQRFQERVDQEREKSEANRRALESEIEESRARADKLQRQLAGATSDEVMAVRGELAKTRDRLVTLESDRLAGERIIRDYGSGVCLIQGSYGFYDGDGRGLRYQLDEMGKPLRKDDGSPALDPGHTGPLFTQDYYGTGFLVDAAGIVMTNHHVAEPWWNDSDAQAFVDKGFKPKFVLFRAFFPRETDPFALAIDRMADGVDLAILRIDKRGRKIPVIPLDRSGTGAIAGQPVVVLGYPAGIEAVLAKADSAIVREVVAASGTSAERMTEALARKGLIRPSTTQGHIGDITKTDIVFDAPTTQGGSGGPVFNRQGVVIAVEYAVLSKFEGNSFGVPIDYALELLKPPKKKKNADD
jgi:S1-C subfamily serine protease